MIRTFFSRRPPPCSTAGVTRKLVTSMSGWSGPVARATAFRCSSRWRVIALGTSPQRKAALRRAIERDPVGFEPRYALGSLLQSSGHSAEARTQLDAAVAANPSHLGRADRPRQHPDGPRRLHGGRSALPPRRVARIRVAIRGDQRRLCAGAAGSASRGARSVSNRLRSRARHGGDTDAFWNFAVALADASRTPDAIAVFESNLPSRPAPHAHWNYAVALLRGGRLAEGWCQHEFRSLLEASAIDAAGLRRSDVDGTAARGQDDRRARRTRPRRHDPDASLRTGPGRARRQGAATFAAGLRCPRARGGGPGRGAEGRHAQSTVRLLGAGDEPARHLWHDARIDSRGRAVHRRRRRAS